MQAVPRRVRAPHRRAAGGPSRKFHPRDSSFVISASSLMDRHIPRL